MGPILRSPAQGVDTTLWLASADQPRRTNGELWLDRHRRRTVHLPGTAVSAAEATRLWNWCVSASGADPERSVRVPSRGRLAAGGLPIMITPRQEHDMRIAIVGTGISGLVCAHLLHPHHDITVFEAGDHVGGHTNTVRVDLDGETHHVDTGFIVHNDRNYPNFVKLMNQLGVATQPSTMSFSVSDPRTGLEYRGTNLNTIFAQRRNLVRPSFLRMLADIVRFNRCREATAARRHRAATSRCRSSSSSRDGSYSEAFIDQFLIPLGASIWSADPETFTHSRRWPTPGSWTTTVCSTFGACPSGGPSPAARSATSTRSSLRSPIASGCGTPSRRSSGPSAGVEVVSRPRRPRDLRPGHPRHAQRPEPAPARRPVAGRARDPRRHPLPAQRRDAAHRRALPAPFAPRPGLVELPPRDAAEAGPRP